MTRLKGILLTGVLLGCLAPARGEIRTSEVPYKEGKADLLGFLAYDDSLRGPRPGVLIVHEWRGHGDYVRLRARQLAEEGYVAFALDMYGKGVYAKDHEEAAKLSGVYLNDRNRLRLRAQAGLQVLQKRPEADPKRLAAIGYCFGGTTVLELARAGEDLRGAASFHGSLNTPVPAKKGDIKAKILVLQGAEDAWTRKALPEFETEMNAAGADWQVVLYGGAVHSFTVKDAGTDPSIGMAYNEKADLRSWQALRDFLEEAFK